jgi:hypothetical protein
MERYATIDSFCLNIDLETREDRKPIRELLSKLSGPIASTHEDTFH